MSQVTLTVPVYKVEPYLCRCVDSILSQTLDDFVLVLVDDGSPDGSGAMCDEFVACDSRVLVIHQPNGGLSAARNVGIDWAEKCSGSKWLAFVDSDDWVHPRYLEHLHRAVAEHNVRVAACEYSEVETYDSPRQVEYKSTRMPWETLFLNNNVKAVVAWNKLYAKDLFDGLRYPVGRIHEDEFLTYKLLHRAQEVAFVTAPLYAYFQNPKGIMRKRFNLHSLDAIDAFAERVGYVYRHRLEGMREWAVRSYFKVSIGRAWELADSTWISEEARKRESSRLRSQARKILIRYGLRVLSPKADYWCYFYAFPKVVHAARLPFVAMRRIRGR